MLRAIDGGTPPKIGVAEYVWVYYSPYSTLDSKTRVIPVFHGDEGPIPLLNPWKSSRRRMVLIPDYYLPDPYQPQPAYVAVCELRNEDNTAHEENTRGRLRKLAQKEGGRLLLEWGFHQEYVVETLTFDEKSWKAVQDHLLRCIDAGVMIHSAQCVEGLRWSFKIGRRPDIDKSLGQDHTLEVCDHLILARHFMTKSLREHGAKLNPSGSGKIYFSTADMRECKETLQAVARRLSGESTPLPSRAVIELREDHLVISNLSPVFDPYTTVASILEGFA